jgi:hypothetical protein
MTPNPGARTRSASATAFTVIDCPDSVVIDQATASRTIGPARAGRHRVTGAVFLKTERPP